MRIGSLNQQPQGQFDSQNMKAYMASSETRKPNDAATKKDISLPYPGPVIQGQGLPKSSGYRTNRINEPAANRNAISSGGDWV
jgi:hypothetical protein